MPSTKPITYYQGRLLVWPLLSLLPPGHSVCLLDTFPSASGSPSTLTFMRWLLAFLDVQPQRLQVASCRIGLILFASSPLFQVALYSLYPTFALTLNGSIYLLSSFRKAWVRGVQYYPCPCSWKKKHVVHPRFLPSELVSSFHKEDT